MAYRNITTDEIETISRKRRVTLDEIEAWTAYLHDQHAPHLPRRVFDRLYDRAYADGHSNGYHEVDQALTDLVELADNIMADLGVNQTGGYGQQQ